MSTNNPNAPESMPTRSHTYLAAGFFSLITVVGAWQVMQSIHAVQFEKLPQSVLDFREGRLTGALEKAIDHQMPLRANLIAYANATRYMLTGGGGDQVRIGNDNWLFIAEELRYEPNAQANLAVRLKLLADTSQQLAAQGIPLVVALVPDKARIYDNKLGFASYPEFNRNRYGETLVQLRKLNVNTVDLLGPLTQTASQTEVYYRTDTHWNQVGAKIAATAVANKASALALDLDKVAFQTTESGSSVERSGDIIRLMGLETVPAALKPRPDIETPAVTKQTTAEASTGLFGDSAVPVVLIGTSYSLRGNFAGYLQEALSAKILSTAKEGGGFLQAASTYFADDAFKQNKPKLIVWEIPERFLYSKIEKESTWTKDVGLAAQ